ncbi:tyrosine-protein phosphatase [Actibacterium sp. MT2.3-13A]|uniref:phosphatase domain-containing protein n=1 Tax=Actibacterium sp. MT2.3-13A TaxID=2828332 RepID=UPI001BA67A30|nr:tyrosine-protein phosphatase [Actibacterium sp. MT2.3-13A]
MFQQIKTRLNDAERDFRAAMPHRFATPAGRRAAFWHFHLMDHAFLRVWWTNMAEIVPGVWRSNQPSPKRLARYKAMGIKTIVSLRGDNLNSHYLFEEEACRALGLELKVASIQARKAPRREKLLHLLEVLENTERPFLIHCKSGADRAGLASALYLMHVEGRPVEEAMRQLSFRHLHLKSTATGILDHILDSYAADNAESPMPVREWIGTRYDRDAMTASFARKRGKRA